MLFLQNLYHQSYNRIGVLFASIPNFHEFYSELHVNSQGKECLRLLNEIISDFDQASYFYFYFFSLKFIPKILFLTLGNYSIKSQGRFIKFVDLVWMRLESPFNLPSCSQLLDEDCFRSVDKIKTVGSTYMAAVGLMPDMRIQDDPASAGNYMSTLAELAFAFRDKLKVINKDSFNNFSLKVGKANEVV